MADSLISVTKEELSSGSRWMFLYSINIDGKGTVIAVVVLDSEAADDEAAKAVADQRASDQKTSMSVVESAPVITDVSAGLTGEVTL